MRQKSKPLCRVMTCETEKLVQVGGVDNPADLPNSIPDACHETRWFCQLIRRSLRKLRSRSMLTAVCEGQYEEGNHRIEYQDDELTFFYRGTPIVKYNLSTEELEEVDAGEFNATHTTRRQRREIAKAVKEFTEVVGRL